MIGSDNLPIVVLFPSMLNTEQQQVFDALNNWVNDLSSRFFILEALPGCGKSYTVAAFLRNQSPADWLITAPTHDVLSQWQEDLPNFSCQTIYKTLGYRPSSLDDGTQIPVKQGGKDRIKPITHKYVVLDESFYVIDAMIAELRDNYHGVKFIFLGDRNQLKPVNGKNDVMAQLCEDYEDYYHRLHINERYSCPKQVSLIDDILLNGFNAKQINKHTVSYGMGEYLIEKQISEGDLDFTFFSYRHKVVDKMAAKIRNLIYNPNGDTPLPEHPIRGERLRLTGVSDRDGAVLAYTNEIVTVTNYNPSFLEVIRANGLKEILPYDEEGKVQEALDVAIRDGGSKAWNNYYGLQRQFVGEVKSPWAKTIHSAQGRTTKQAYIDREDTKLSGDTSLLTVAASRSKQVAIFLK